MKKLKKIVTSVVLVFVSCQGYSQENVSNKKLLQHVLLLQWTEGYDIAVKAEVISLFEGLPDKIDGLENFEIHKIISSSGKFHDVLTFQFTSEEALKQYEVHPDHIKVTKIAPPILSSFAEYDYWH